MKRFIASIITVLALQGGIARGDVKEEPLTLVAGVSRLMKFPFELGVLHLVPVANARMLMTKKVLNRSGNADSILFIPMKPCTATLTLYDKGGAAQRRYAVSVVPATPAAVTKHKQDEKSDRMQTVDVDLVIGSGKIMELPFDVGSIILTDQSVAAYQRIEQRGQPVRNVQIVPVKEGITDVVVCNKDFSSLVKYYVHVKAK